MKHFKYIYIYICTHVYTLCVYTEWDFPNIKVLVSFKELFFFFLCVILSFIFHQNVASVSLKIKLGRTDTIESQK